MTGRIFIVALVLALGAGVLKGISRPEQPPTRAPLRELAFQIGGWKGQDQADFDAKTLAVLGVDDYITRLYVAADHHPVSLYIGYYQSQRTGSTIHSPMNCLPGSGWQPLETSTEQLVVEGASGRPNPITINRYLVQKGLQRHVVLFWYQMHGRVIASEYTNKFFLIHDAVQLNRTDGALVRVIVPIAESEGVQATDDAARAFVRAVFPRLSAHLPT